MKTFFRFSIVLFSALFAVVGSSKADIAVEGYPNQHHVANGRYLRDLRPDRSLEYKAYRSDENYTAQLIRYNLATGRWELYLTKRAGGEPERVAWSDVVPSTNVIVSGWRTTTDTPGTVYVSWPLKVYIPIDQYATCSSCNWSNPLTWPSRIVPRTYDNVIIDGNVLLDVPSKCNNLLVKTGTVSSPIRSLVGRSPESKIKIHGNLEHQLGTLLDVVEIEFAGNEIQTIETDISRGVTIYTSRVRINNSKQINLGSAFSFARSGTIRCETIFEKGKISLGSYDLTCESITGADETRFVVTNGAGMLKLYAPREGEAMLHRFPVGPSTDRYTPIMVLFATANRGFATMRAKAAYNPSIFLPGRHVNIVYTVDHGTALPPSGTPLTWVYQFQWDAADATTDFNPAHPVEIKKWNGSLWSDAIAGPVVTGTGPYKTLFTARSTSVNHFGVSTQIKRPAERLNAEEVEVKNAEMEVDFTTFPNPATSGGFKVRVGDADAAKIKLVNLSGASIRFRAEKESANTVSLLPLDTMFPGVYILHVQEKNLVRTHKVLIK